MLKRARARTRRRRCGGTGALRTGDRPVWNGDASHRPEALSGRIASATSRTGFPTFIGDYNYLSVSGSDVFPVWTDRRFGNNDIVAVKGSLGGG